MLWADVFFVCVVILCFIILWGLFTDAIYRRVQRRFKHLDDR